MKIPSVYGKPIITWLTRLDLKITARTSGMSLRGGAGSLDVPDSGHRPICSSGCSNHSNIVIIMEAAQIDPGQTQCIYLFACTLASLLTCEDKQGSPFRI